MISKEQLFTISAPAQPALCVREGVIQDTAIIANDCLVDLTDENWTNGYSNTANTLLFSRNEALLAEMLFHEKIVCGNESYFIKNVDYDNLWIRVTVDRDASACMYPAKIHIQ